MAADFYPWGGEYTTGNPDSPVAVVTLADKLKLPMDKVAIQGRMKTENLGIEKVMANVISNPNIRFLIVFGEEIRGHRAGGSIIALHRNGIDETRRIRDASGAVPYIENINDEAVQRFRDQVEIVDLLNETDMGVLLESIEHCLSKDPGSFGEQYIAIQINTESRAIKDFEDSLALHSSLAVSPFLEISGLGHKDTGIRLHASLTLTPHGRVGPVR